MWIVESFLCCMANWSSQMQLYCGQCNIFGADRHILVGANKRLKYKTQPYMCLYWTYLSLTELIASICITGKWCVCQCLFILHNESFSIFPVFDLCERQFDFLYSWPCICVLALCHFFLCVNMFAGQVCGFPFCKCLLFYVPLTCFIVQENCSGSIVWHWIRREKA